MVQIFDKVKMEPAGLDNELDKQREGEKDVENVPMLGLGNWEYSDSEKNRIFPLG